MFTVGLSVFLWFFHLPGGPLLDHLSFIKHEVQAVADHFNDCEKHSHRAAVEQRSYHVWREGLNTKKEENNCFLFVLNLETFLDNSVSINWAGFQLISEVTGPSLNAQGKVLLPVSGCLLLFLRLQSL